LVTDLLNQFWAQFLMVCLLAFILGLEFREYLADRRDHITIGSVRTYTYIAILGFLLYSLDHTWKLYLGGMFALTVLFGIFYFSRLPTGQHGILHLLLGLIIYTFGPIAQTMPLWFLPLVFVSLIFVLGARPLTHRMLETMDRLELVTLAKFVLLSAVILPLLPRELLGSALPISPYNIWLAVVLVSSISYLGYILERYVFPTSGYLLTGLLGGLYSSTATTVALARNTRDQTKPDRMLHGAILAASAMMYLRLWVLVALLAPTLLWGLGWPLAVLGAATLSGAMLYVRTSPISPKTSDTSANTRNPLNLGTAFLFSGLMILMLSLTHYVSHQFGTSGLEALSLVTGFTDIDPFVLSLLKGAFDAVSPAQVCGALLMAAGSNNLLKGLYTLVVGNPKANAPVAVTLLLLGGITIVWGLALF
jgi:uncharacterized membrane protein (DUF4010 family)